MSEKSADIFLKKLWEENPVFVHLLGMCPVLAVSNSVVNAISMGMATMFVLVMSSLLISLLRRFIPKEVRIATFIMIIATFVTLAEYFIQALSVEIHKSLGAFISLIVVNCIILGRAEAFASKNTVIRSALDGLGMSIGFTVTLFILGAFREILGSGTLTLFVMNDIELKFDLFKSANIPGIAVMILPPGAFLGLGIMLAARNKIQRRLDAKS